MTDPRFDIHKIHNDLEAKKAGRKSKARLASRTSPLTGGRTRRWWETPLTNGTLICIMLAQFCAGAAVGAWLW